MLCVCSQTLPKCGVLQSAVKSVHSLVVYFSLVVNASSSSARSIGLGLTLLALTLNRLRANLRAALEWRLVS
jgi:hypothetical protein